MSRLKAFLILVIPVFLSLSTVSVFWSDGAYAENKDDWRRNQQLMNSIRRQQTVRQSPIQQRRSTFSLSREFAQTQRQARAQRIQGYRASAQEIQKNISKRLRKNEHNLLRQRENQQIKALREKRDRTKLALASLAISRTQITTRLSQLPKVGSDAQRLSPRVVARAMRERPQRPTVEISRVDRRFTIPERPAFMAGTAGAARPFTKAGTLKWYKLPTSGPIRFVPERSWIPTNDLKKKKIGKRTGLVDKFGNVWLKGPSRTSGEEFEWDVQLSESGKKQLGQWSRTGSHLNVSLEGKVTH